VSYGSSTFGIGAFGATAPAAPAALPPVDPPVEPLATNPIRFTRARTVAAGGLPTSTDLRSLAAAVNDRLLSGVGDCAWRISWYLFNLWRQDRNPDSSGYLFPPQGEFFDIYGAIDPSFTDVIHPTAGPGDPEGSNLASTMPGFVHGDPENFSEADALSGFSDGATATLHDKWELGKLQRGARDPNTGAQGWPAGDAAQRFMRITAGTWSPHAKAWGGYLPTATPVYTGYGGDGYRCGADEETGLYQTNREVKFTALRAGVDIPAGHGGTASTVGGVSVITYAGNCGCGSDASGAGHVLMVWEGPLAYYAYVRTAGGLDCTTNAVRFPLEDWLHGPYEGVGRLAHTDGKQLNRVIHAFASDFRGTPTQREPDTFDITKIALPAEEIMGRQYLLAPARGIQAGEWITVQYPSAVFSGADFIPAGSSKQLSPATGLADHVISGVIARAYGLQTATAVSLMDGGTSIRTLTLNPDETGYAEAMHWFTAPVRRSSLEAVVASDATFDGEDTGLHVEVAELQEMKPQYWDLYLMARMGAAGNQQQVRGRGLDYTESKTVGQNYLESGCIVGTSPDIDEPEINRNPVWDVARRLTNSCLRIINRRQFVAYEVADGKSILYLKRFAYGMENTRLDLLAGIAPQIDPVAEVVEGEAYVVRSVSGLGIIRYTGREYGNGATFTGTDDPEFAAEGDAALYVRDGIKSTALEKGWTNRWCSFVETQCYHVSESSLYKPAALADYFTFSDRCMFRSGMYADDILEQSSFNYGVSVDAVDGHMTQNDPWVRASWMAPELPTGYRYAAHPATGTIYDTAEHRNSCRIYEAPVEVESAVVHDFAQGIVKLTFTGRFHSHPDAPATWSSAAPSWGMADAVPAEVTALIDEVSGTGGYRTTDNALREYHVHQANGHYQCKRATGDGGIQNDLGSESIFGSCYPHIHLVALMREPYEDGNDTVEPHDSRMRVDELQRAELYLRASCEGFIDARTSTEIICASGNGGLFEYTFGNCCFDAFGGRWIGSVGLPLRPENPEGYGPLPNTKLYGDVFNRLSSAWNLLDKARVEIPMELKVRVTDGVGGTVDMPVHFTGGSSEISFGQAAPVGAGTSDGLWYVASDIATNYVAAGTGTAVAGDVVQIAYGWTMREFKLEPVSTTSYQCLPPAIQALVEESATGFIAEVGRDIDPGKLVAVNSSAAAYDCFGTKLWDGSRGYDVSEVVVSTTCEFISSGTADPRPLAGTTGDFGSQYVSGGCAFGISNIVTITPIDLTLGTYLQVPLVDLA
jgi:hypothetical protein